MGGVVERNTLEIQIADILRRLSSVEGESGKLFQTIFLQSWSDFTTTWGGFSSDPTPATIRYIQIGNIVYVQYTTTVDGTSNATSLTCTLPIEAFRTENVHCCGRAVDNGSIQSTPAMVKLTASSNVATFYKDQAEAAWTGSGNKTINFTFFYEVA